jgi:anti-anti-sigma regulatory factor/HAMP domain-containing protein
MWHNRSLRTRILLGYGLILGLASALALFLVLHFDGLNHDMQELNTRVASATDVGMHMTRDVATTQQAVNRYLQQPEPAHLQAVHDAMSHLTTDLGRIEAVQTDPEQRMQLSELKHQLQVYHTTFESIRGLLKEQEPLHARLNSHLSRATTLLNNTIGQAQHGNAFGAQTTQLSAAQTNLQQANLWFSRLATEPSKNLGTNAIAELDKVSQILRQNIGQPGSPANVRLDSTLSEIGLATGLAQQLVQSIDQMQQKRSQTLALQGEVLSRQTSTITQQAMTNLTTATNSLARQTRQIHEITGVALLITLVLVLVFAFGLAHTITHPLKEFVTATARVVQGDYSVTVSQTDGSEIGQLATIFNQMTSTLSQQRTEMLSQQAAIVSRNQELEHALAEIEAATAQRAALAATVRALSVPVVPILDHVIVVSLVGEIDEQRGRLLLDRLLDGITAQQANIAILDVTGVPYGNTTIVDWLLKAAQAAKLLGTHCLLVGIRPEVAQAMVASGMDLADITTRATLRDAVEYTLQLAPNKPQSASMAVV